MTKQDHLDNLIRTKLQEDGNWYLSEEIRMKFCPDYTNHQVRQSLSRMMPDGVIVSKIGNEGQYRLYAYNPLHDGTRLINRIWR